MKRLIAAMAIVFISAGISEAVPTGPAPLMYNKTQSWVLNGTGCAYSGAISGYYYECSDTKDDAAGYPAATATYSYYSYGGSAPTMETTTTSYRFGKAGANAYSSTDQQYGFYIDYVDFQSVPLPFIETVPILIYYTLFADTHLLMGDEYYEMANAEANLSLTVYGSGFTKYIFSDKVRAQSNSTVYSISEASSNILSYDLILNKWNTIRIQAMSNAATPTRIDPDMPSVSGADSKAFVDPTIVIDPSWAYAGLFRVVQENVAPPPPAPAVPEPSTFLLLGGGLGGFALMRRFRKK